MPPAMAGLSEPALTAATAIMWRIRHNSTYKPAYAHLSRYGRGVRSGVRVEQGQVIGDVGSTGLATGPHLHYKVLVNGKQANAANLKLPTGKTVTGTQLAEFDDWRTAVDQTVLALHT